MPCWRGLMAGAGLLALSGCLQSTELGGASSFAKGATGVSGDAQGADAALQTCASPLGTVALVEDQHIYSGYYTRYGLESPLPVLRLMIGQSGCFNVVDRGQALTRIQQEELLTGRSGSAQKMVGAQYFLTPNVVFSDEDSGGASGALSALGRYLPGEFGSIAGNLGLQQSEVQSVLFLTQTSTGLQVSAAEGSAKNSDLTLGGFGWISGLGGAARAYASTDMGKLVVASLVDAYNKMVTQLRSQSGTS